MKAWITQLRKGLVEFCVLTVLSDKETYGYDLVRRLQGLEELAITESTVYLVIARLRRDGYVKARREDSAIGPARRYLSLTRLGELHRKQMDAYWKELCAAVNLLRAESSGEVQSDEGRG